VYAITVGSESMYRGNFTGEQLLAKIKDMKSSAPQFKIGTADSWNKYQDGTADPLIKEVDLLYVGPCEDEVLRNFSKMVLTCHVSSLCNAFSYWQGQLLNNATGSFFDDIMQAFGRIQSISGSTDKPELWVGETGMSCLSHPPTLSYLPNLLSARVIRR
jgi:glucan 1,3-beta-glucosidase